MNVRLILILSTDIKQKKDNVMIGHVEISIQQYAVKLYGGLLIVTHHA